MPWAGLVSGEGARGRPGARASGKGDRVAAPSQGDNAAPCVDLWWVQELPLELLADAFVEKPKEKSEGKDAKKDKAPMPKKEEKISLLDSKTLRNNGIVLKRFGWVNQARAGVSCLLLVVGVGARCRLPPRWACPIMKP